MSGLEIERTNKSFHVLDRTRMIAKCTENGKKKDKRQNKICKFMTLMSSFKYVLGVNSYNINDTKKSLFFFHCRPFHPFACTV